MAFVLGFRANRHCPEERLGQSSICGSMARQVMVQPHFLHLTTQAWGSPEKTTCHYGNNGRRIYGESYDPLLH